MKKQILLAKSNCHYIKIQKEGNPTIIIFDTQPWINEFIKTKINKMGENVDCSTLEDLQKICTNENYEIFLAAYQKQSELKENYDRYRYKYYKGMNEYDDFEYYNMDEDPDYDRYMYLDIEFYKR